MRTMKLLPSILSLTISLSLLYSCEESGIDSFSDDLQLIQAIESADNSVPIQASELPLAITSTLDAEYAADFVSQVMHAPQLGYSVEITRAEGALVGEASQAYFAEDGRELDADNQDPRRGGKHDRRMKFLNDCFSFVYPISLTMYDGSVIDLESKEDWQDVREWLKANHDDDPETRPEFNFPLDIEFENGDLYTVSSGEELRAVVEEECGAFPRKRMDCFEFVYPITFTMPDSSEIVLASKEDRSLLKEWHDANPDVEGRGIPNFPVDVIFGEETITVTDLDQLREIGSSCERRRDREGCFDLVFPFTLIMSDDTEITLETEVDWEEVKAWHDANSDSHERPELVFPVDVEYEDGTITTIASDEEMRTAREECNERG